MLEPWKCENEPDVFELVKTHQIRSHSGTCWKYNKIKYSFSYRYILTGKAIIEKPLEAGQDIDDKNEIQMCRKTLLKKVSCYLDSHLNPPKKKYRSKIDRSIAQSWNVSRASSCCWWWSYSSSLSKDYYFDLNLKRNSKSCFVNNYFNDRLKTWNANVDIQRVFDEYKRVTYMCSYFSQIKDQCSQSKRKQLRRLFRTICIIMKQWK